MRKRIAKLQAGVFECSDVGLTKNFSLYFGVKISGPAKKTKLPVIPPEPQKVQLSTYYFIFLSVIKQNLIFYRVWQTPSDGWFPTLIAL